MVVVAATQGESESSYVLEKMEVGMFKFCLQKPKSVIFERLVRRFGYGVGGERKKKRKRAS